MCGGAGRKEDKDMLTYGYRDVNGRIELDPETAPLMREFFRLSARGMALRPAAEKAGIPIRAKWKREGGISRTALATALHGDGALSCADR